MNAVTTSKERLAAPLAIFALQVIKLVRKILSLSSTHELEKCVQYRFDLKQCRMVSQKSSSRRRSRNHRPRRETENGILKYLCIVVVASTLSLTGLSCKIKSYLGPIEELLISTKYCGCGKKPIFLK